VDCVNLLNGKDIYLNGDIDSFDNKTQVNAEVMVFDPKTKICNIMQFNIIGNDGLENFLRALASGQLNKMELKDKISGTIDCFLPDLNTVVTTKLNLKTDISLNPVAFLSNKTNDFLHGSITTGYTEGATNITINGTKIISMEGSFYKEENGILKQHSASGDNVYPSNSSNGTIIDLGSLIKKVMSSGDKTKLKNMGVIFGNDDIMIFDEKTSLELSQLHIPVNDMSVWGFVKTRGISQDFVKPPKFYKISGSRGYPLMDNETGKYTFIRYNEDINGKYEYLSEYNNTFYYKKEKGGNWILRVEKKLTPCDKYIQFVPAGLQGDLQYIFAETDTGAKLQPYQYLHLNDNSELASKWKPNKLTSDPSDGTNIANDDVITCFAGPRRTERNRPLWGGRRQR
jgi:hypothetical protein